MKAASSTVETAQAFDDGVSNWNDYQETPWGRLHYRISQENLRRHLPPLGRLLHVLDVGGGSGTDALFCAREGHTVTLIDVAGKMLDEARRQAEQAGVEEQIEIISADLAAIPSLYPHPAFDAVLCHNIVQYTDDASAMLRTVCHPLRVGGLLSLISVNRYSEALREALLWLDPAAALKKLGAKEARSRLLGTTLLLWSSEELMSEIEAAGLTVMAQYGIRSVNDYIPNNDLKTDPAFFAQLEQLELAMSAQYPYYLLARELQIIARKQVPPEDIP